MKRGMDAFRREVVNLPNGITIGRLFLIPPVLVLMGSDETWRNVSASLLFATASGLDVLDGYLARRQGLVTVFGKFVDPLADKLMAMAVMIYLVALDALAPWIVVIMLGRDLYINGLRQISAERGVVIAAGSGGKVKTAIQLIGLCCVLVRARFEIPGVPIALDFTWIGLALIYIAVVLSITSAIQYTFGFGHALRNQSAEH